MKMLLGSGLVLVLVPALLAVPAPPAKPVELVVNGSFEEGPEVVGNTFLPVNEGSTAIKGWTVINGQIDLLDGWCKAADGKRALDLCGSPGVGGVKQTFKTVKGQKYRVTLSLAANFNTQFPRKRLGVKAAGAQTAFEFDGTGKTAEDPGWKTETWEFTATDKETTVELYAIEKDDQTSGPILDSVSVKVVPPK